MTGLCENVGYGGESVTIGRESETDVVFFSVFEDRPLYRRRLHINRRTAKWYPTPVWF
jgi:hypothetical protein